MAFWSSQRLEANLASLTSHPEPEMVDCNALTLRVGPEIYITPGLEQIAPHSHTKELLQPDAPIAVPPGRFAFLLTEETITIPAEAMGFISIKATFKLRGLVNVSGFHVDPGWTGPLIFTVFNAGPTTIHLQRGLPVFLLWIADLDAASDKRKTKPGSQGIPPGNINNISGVVDSIYALEKRVKSDVKAVADQLTDMKHNQQRILIYFGLAAVLGGAFVGALVKMTADHLFPPSTTAAAPAASFPTPLSATSTPMRPSIAPANANLHKDAIGNPP